MPQGVRVQVPPSAQQSTLRVELPTTWLGAGVVFLAGLIAIRSQLVLLLYVGMWIATGLFYNIVTTLGEPSL